MTFSLKATPDARLKTIGKLIDQLKADTRPILCGPWRSELGFEALYWTAFLRRLSQAVPTFDQRAIVVTRGGLAPLYTQVATRGFDLFALRSVTEVRRENLFDYQASKNTDGGKTMKQFQVTPWDEAVLDDAAGEFGVGLPYHVVHPSWMYWACDPFWTELAGLRYLASLCDFAPLPKPAVDGGLPPKYVAVKFYARHTFPYPHQEIAEFVQKVVGTIAQQTNVVVLSAGPEYDDHVDIPLSGPNIQTMPTVPPEQNLLAQASLVAHATAFVGTYGGMAQLALRLGVPSVSFYAQWGGTSHAHLALSSWLSKSFKVPFLVGDLQDAQIWKQVVSVPQGYIVKDQMDIKKFAKVADGIPA